MILSPKGRGNGLNLNAPQRISLAAGKYHSRREYHVIEDNISRAIGTYLCLSLRFVPRSHFILHFAFCILHWRSPACPYGLFLVRTPIIHYLSFIIHYSFSVSALRLESLTGFQLSTFIFQLFSFSY